MSIYNSNQLKFLDYLEIFSGDYSICVIGRTDLLFGMDSFYTKNYLIEIFSTNTKNNIMTIMVYIEGNTVRDDTRKIIGYITSNSTRDENKRLVARSRLPGLLFCK